MDKDAENTIAAVDTFLDLIRHVLSLRGLGSERIAGLERAIVPTLAKSEQTKLRFFSTPDALFTFIEELDAKDSNRVETVRGYRVNVSHQVVDRTSKEDRAKMLAKVVADSAKRRRE